MAMAGGDRGPAVLNGSDPAGSVFSHESAVHCLLIAEITPRRTTGVNAAAGTAVDASYWRPGRRRVMIRLRGAHHHVGAERRRIAMAGDAGTTGAARIAGPVLVAGANGMLGGAVARRLLARGVRVRALGRRPGALASLRALGADVVEGDARDPEVAARACAGVAQLVTTLNNVMGTGANSPTTVDRPAHRSLANAATDAQVRRWLHVSALGVSRDNPVDYFRVKHGVDEIVTTSGMPWVLVQPSAFMETWITTLLGDSMRRENKATLFGRGDRVANFVAVDDVAAVIEAVLADEGVRDERIPVGGPTTMTYLDAVAAIEEGWGLRVRRVFVPRWLLSIGRHVAGRFDEKVGRLMSLGYWSATADTRCDEWAETAARFGVSPRSVAEYLRDTAPGAGAVAGSPGSAASTAVPRAAP
jgi:uncharacterized protein YbjT (DUF2867 family)